MPQTTMAIRARPVHPNDAFRMVTVLSDTLAQSYGSVGGGTSLSSIFFNMCVAMFGGIVGRVRAGLTGSDSDSDSDRGEQG